MHHRRPSARHGDGVTGKGFKHRTLARLAAHLYARDAFAACDPRHGMTHHHANAQIFGARHQRGILRQHASIQNGGHGQTGLGQGDGGAVGIVVVGDHHRAIPDRHAIVHQIIPHRGGQHHTGDVIASKGQRPFNRAGGGHDMTGANAPEPVARPSNLRRVVRQPFIAQHIAVVIDARPHDTGAQGNVFHPRQLCHQRVDEVGDGCAIDRAAIHGSAAAPMGGLFQHDDLGTGQGRRARGFEPRDTTADDQHVAKGVEMFIGIAIRLLRRFAQTGRVADDRLVDMLPEGARVDEHLVVEARGQKAAEVFVDRANVEFEAGPVVLAFRLEPVEKIGGRGALVGFKPVALPEVHQRVGFFRARRHDAARTVVFERPPHQHLVIRQQGRGQGIALEAAQLLSVERKTDSI